MDPDDTATLGALVRDLREKSGLTQEALGMKAGYQAGAGVSISRFENGQVRPGPQKLQRIAEVLGTSREALEAQAEKRGQSRAETLKERDKRITSQAMEQARSLREISDRFDEARDRARTDFLEKFAAIADRVGAPAFGRQTQSHAEATGDTAADRQQQATQAIAGTLANGATSALVLKSMKDVKPFATALAGSVGTVGLAIPALLVIAGAAISVITTSRQQQGKRSRDLDILELALEAEAPGLAELMRLLPRATEILDYIAVHAGHDLERWERRIGAESLTWEGIGRDGQNRYREFLQICGAQIVVQDLPLNVLPSITDINELHDRVAEIEASLAKSQEVVTSLV